MLLSETFAISESTRQFVQGLLGIDERDLAIPAIGAAEDAKPRIRSFNFRPFSVSGIASCNDMKNSAVNDSRSPTSHGLKSTICSMSVARRPSRIKFRALDFPDPHGPISPKTEEAPLLRDAVSASTQVWANSDRFRRSSTALSIGSSSRLTFAMPRRWSLRSRSRFHRCFGS